MSERTIKRALISVYDKTSVVEFARALVDEFGIEIISTGGTASLLKENGIPVTLVEKVTRFPEMMDGRVKTLHPKIHAAILADRDNPEHMRQLKEQGIEPIDMVVVNLYPFEKTVADPTCTFEEAIEMIDIGGPCLLRAAAKNHQHVLPITDPGDYGETLTWLRRDAPEEEGRPFYRDSACRAFQKTARYDADIAGWLSREDREGVPEFRAIHLNNLGPLRYGENPHQTAERLELAGTLRARRLTIAGAGSEPGVEMSFNNYVDANAALQLCGELTRAVAGRAKILFAHDERTDTRETESGRMRPFGPVSDEVLTRRNLPHWQIAGATYIVTFRSAIGELTASERDIVLDALRFWDGKRLDLHAAVVMPDHVHALLTPRSVSDRPHERYNLSKLLQSIKAHAGREISKHRKGTGQVWVRESFDRWVRSEGDFVEKWRYIADNPVKEGLAPTSEEYPWWYGVEATPNAEEGTEANDGTGRKLSKENLCSPHCGDPRTQNASETLASQQDVSKEDLCSPHCGDPRTQNASETPASQQDVSKEDLCSPHCGDPRTQNARKTRASQQDMSKEDLCSPRVVTFIKHTNACGVGVADNPIEAYRRAYLGDPNAAMGGIAACNFDIDGEIAQAVMETYGRWGKAAGAGGFFVEVWIAPFFDSEACDVIRKSKKWGERVRLLAVGDLGRTPNKDELDYKRITGGMLVQQRDLIGLDEDQWKVVTKRTPTDAEMTDLRLAWLICKHTKSNAITICKDNMLIGNGAGQMSRVMSCRIATWLAKENGHSERLPGSVAASDAFFPFRDGPDILTDAGVTAIIQPGGSKRDEDTIAACDERNVAMIFTGTRHFRH